MKIKFIYSSLYEQRISGKKPAVPFDIAQTKLKKLDVYWKRHGKRIEQALYKVVGLKFKEDMICYINSQQTFSEPLSIDVSYEFEDIRDNLIHELIHVLLTQNISIMQKAMSSFHDEYKQYNFTTRVHIIIHAIHSKIADLIMPDRQSAIKNFSKHTDYVESWKIVDALGADRIVGFIERQRKTACAAGFLLIKLF